MPARPRRPILLATDIISGESQVNVLVEHFRAGNAIEAFASEGGFSINETDALFLPLTRDLPDDVVDVAISAEAQSVEIAREGAVLACFLVIAQGSLAASQTEMQFGKSAIHQCGLLVLQDGLGDFFLLLPESRLPDTLLPNPRAFSGVEVNGMQGTQWRTVSQITADRAKGSPLAPQVTAIVNDFREILLEMSIEQPSFVDHRPGPVCFRNISIPCHSRDVPGRLRLSSVFFQKLSNSGFLLRQCWPE